MDKIRKLGKIIVFDALAILCFIGVILFGWIPGPGGIPLFLAGLGFLAINHDWAERLLEQVKVHGVSLKKTLFPDIRWVRNVYDLVAISLAITSTYLMFSHKNKIVLAISTAIFIFSLFVFLVNRDRFDKFSTYLKKKPKA